MKKIALSLACSLFFLLSSCEESVVKSEATNDLSSDSTTVPVPTEKNKTTGDTLSSGSLKVYPLSDSPLFNDAILTLNTPAEKAEFGKGAVSFSYDIKNYQLAKPTAEGSCAINCANSDQGQHIHLILNNEPYLAKYTTAFEEKLSPGRYVALSFLSRSYHESIKHYEAYDLRQFTVGKTTAKEVDLTQPMLFYSRPKGEYKGKDSKKILLDFYVINATLAVNDYNVRATIDGSVFLLSSWKGYLIEGLSAGEHTVKIELLDKKGELVQSPYAVTERTITVSPDTIN